MRKRKCRGTGGRPVDIGYSSIGNGGSYDFSKFTRGGAAPDETVPSSAMTSLLMQLVHQVTALSKKLDAVIKRNEALERQLHGELAAEATPVKDRTTNSARPQSQRPESTPLDSTSAAPQTATKTPAKTYASTAQKAAHKPAPKPRQTPSEKWKTISERPVNKVATKYKEQVVRMGQPSTLNAVKRLHIHMQQVRDESPSERQHRMNLYLKVIGIRNMVHNFSTIGTSNLEIYFFEDKEPAILEKLRANKANILKKFNPTNLGEGSSEVLGLRTEKVAVRLALLLFDEKSGAMKSAVLAGFAPAVIKAAKDKANQMKNRRDAKGKAPSAAEQCGVITDAQAGHTEKVGQSGIDVNEIQMEANCGDEAPRELSDDNHEMEEASHGD